MPNIKHNSPLSRKIENLVIELKHISETSTDKLDTNPSLNGDVIKIQSSVQILSVMLAEIQHKVCGQPQEVIHELIKYDDVITRVENFVSSANTLLAQID